jgi:uncharacterized protein (DUF1015 family)
MAEIQPFRMVHYDRKFAAELDRLITPPYDVISKEEQESFYAAHPLNVIRLVLGKQFHDDANGNNRYTRAAANLRQWLDDGVLNRESYPGITVYQMEFEQPGHGTRVIDGIVCLIKVDDYGKGKVLPHEKTYKGPKQDRLDLLSACRANLTPIHALFGDEPHLITDAYSRYIQEPPDQETKDPNGTVHRTWNIFDPGVIKRLQNIFKEKSLFIADGHHRYETARAYKDQMRAAGHTNPTDPHEYVMAYLTSMTHPGLVILPAHRMVKGLSNLDLGKFLAEVRPYFNIEELCFNDQNRQSVFRTLIERIESYSEVGGKFGMIIQGEPCFRLLRLKDFHAAESLIDSSIPAPLRALDVTILREAIMNHGLGMDGENAEGKIEYTPLIEEALKKVITGDIQISFVLNPTRVDQVQSAAELGHKLPHKSTYFYPKISSGLVLRVF